ncbi:zinc finger protein 2 homolog [Lucilia sericata]|uniref:zinc finger protein 2 homolog n=1 Tax=Lucilia sericata TaxID=13632 RepID=UPI0018A82578|nr:zinc finger protein 2 homolog [Lucilia sericata]
MGANNLSNLQKCGEILIDIKTKNRKNKIYIFHCTFCDIQCDQLKKFSLHLGEAHLNNSEDILKESELKLETEPEEVRINNPTDIESTDIKKDFGSTVQNSTYINSDPLDTIDHPLRPNLNHDTVNYVIKCELKENSNDGSTYCEKYEMDCALSTAASDDEANEKLDISNFSSGYSEDEIKEDADEMPLKKLKLNFTKGRKRVKQKTHKNEMGTDESKDAEDNSNISDVSTDDSRDSDFDIEKELYTDKKSMNPKKHIVSTMHFYTYKKESKQKLVANNQNSTQKEEKESNTIKKHKRCKKRWKNIDDSELPVLIEMYKKYEVLWQVNDIAFGILPKRNETFGKMIEELKANHNFDKNLDELQDYIDYINYIFFKDKEKELKCELDKTEFTPSSKFYKELLFLSDSQGPFKCSNCDEIIAKYDRYHIHVAQHNGTIPFQCRLCEMGFQKFDNYIRHVTRHLGINSYHCNVCGKGYPFKSELDWHLTSHTGVKPYLCPICGAGFRARHGYDNHIRRHEKRFRYECHICKHGFNHLCKLNTHIKSHLNIRDVICNVCGKGFTAAKYLHRHKLIHEEEKRYKCNVCGKAFAQDSGLRTHRKQHQPYATIAENKNLLNVFK